YSFDQTHIQEELIHYLRNHLPESLNKKVNWYIEKSEQLKASKGVFSVPGSDNSFIAAEITDFGDLYTLLISKNIEETFTAKINPTKINLYFNVSGVGSC